MHAGDLARDLNKNKKFDVSLLNDTDSQCVVKEWLTTGCLALDWILGGGIPVGRITEIYGDNSTGKSLIAAQVVANAQDAGHIALMADTESAVSLPVLKAVGVNVNELIYSVPDTVEQTFSLFEEAIETKKQKYPNCVLLLVWDSVAATSVEAEMDADYGKPMMGRHANLISQSMRKITRLISKDRIAAIFINQTREKIGVMFGDKESTFGGKAIGFHASVRLRLKASSKLKKGNKIVAIETRAQAVKNKVATPFRSATLPIFFKHGIDDELTSLYWLEENGFITKMGSSKTMTIGDEELRFNKASWAKVYEDHYEDFANLILNYGDDDEDGELEEAALAEGTDE